MTQFVLANQTPQDKVGRSLPKARLYFYDNNTFNFKDVYSDTARTSVLPNPVIADGSGVFPAIYLALDSNYRVSLKDRHDIQVTPFSDDQGVNAQGLGTAAYLDAQTSDIDGAANKVLKTGAFGLGSTSGIVYADADDVGGYAHFVRFTSSTLNTPIPSNFFEGYTVAGSGFSCVTVELVASGIELPRSFKRSNRNGTWTEWAEVFTPGNTIGPVSQSGGIPTGAIIESGTNANGSFTKYADGTLICTFLVDAATPVFNLTGAIYETDSKSWTFPVLFVGLPTGYSVNEVSGVGSCWGGLGTGATTTTDTSFKIFRAVSIAATPKASLMAIGRWF